MSSGGNYGKLQYGILHGIRHGKLHGLPEVYDMVNTKKKLPSRIKYDNSHPVVSCRVSSEIYDKLTEAREKYGKSLADILKVGLKLQDIASAKSWDKGYKAGYAKGEAEGKVEGVVAAMSEVTLGLCTRCGKTLDFDLNDNEQLTEVSACISEHLVHDNCV